MPATNNMQRSTTRSPSTHNRKEKSSFGDLDDYELAFQFTRILFGIIGFVCVFIEPYWQEYLPFYKPLLLENQHLQIVICICSAITLSSGSLFFLILIFVRLRRVYWRWFRFISYVFLFSAILAFIVTLPFIAEVDLTQNGFVQSDIIINAGNSITFVNSGFSQELCIGSNRVCDSATGNSSHAPSKLSQGQLIAQGQSIKIFFDSVGDYHITTNQDQASVNITVHVLEVPPNEPEGD